MLDDIPRVRNADPETSHQAARQLSTADSHCRAMLREAWFISMTDMPLFTDEVLAEKAGLREHGICWWPAHQSGFTHTCSAFVCICLPRWRLQREWDGRQFAGI